MSAERWASCPSCDRPTRLTEPELEAKRGFCAVCDAEFEIRAGMVRDGITPFRDAGGAELVPVGASPYALIRPPDDEPLRALSIHATKSKGWGYPIVLTFMVMLMWDAIARSLGLSHPAIILGIWILAGAGAIPSAMAAARNYLAQDTLLVRDGLLCFRRWPRRRWRELPLTSVRSIELELERPEKKRHDGRIIRPERWRLRIATKDGPLRVAAGLGHDKAALAWVKTWLEQKIETALVDAQKALPTPGTAPRRDRPLLSSPSANRRG